MGRILKTAAVSTLALGLFASPAGEAGREPAPHTDIAYELVSLQAEIDAAVAKNLGATAIKPKSSPKVAGATTTVLDYRDATSAEAASPASVPKIRSQAAQTEREELKESALTLSTREVLLPQLGAAGLRLVKFVPETTDAPWVEVFVTADEEITAVYNVRVNQVDEDLLNQMTVGMTYFGRSADVLDETKTEGPEMYNDLLFHAESELTKEVPLSEAGPFMAYANGLATATYHETLRNQP